MAFGVALMVQTKLGVSPISSLPYVFNLEFTWISLGNFTILWNLVLIAGQLLILRRKFQWFQLIQLPITLIFGVFVDGCKLLVSSWNLDHYWLQMLFLLLGCTVLALGVTLTVLAGVVMNSGEAFVAAIAGKTGWNFGTVKVGFDSSLVLLAILFSLLFFGRMEGVREGTILAALLSGFIVRLFTRVLKKPVERWETGTKS
ncbi:MAG: YitT family protein [Oscillospiraceae bacterium]|nr:YitT family protein [Oscillospiraceae bacterium]